MSTYTQHFSASSLKKIDLYVPEAVTVAVSNIKPKPPLGGFKKYNKCRNYNYHGQNLENSSPKCFVQILDGKQLNCGKSKSEVLDGNNTSKRRVQSAKPRLMSDKGKTYGNERELNHATKGQKVKTNRPVSAIVLGSGTHWNYSYSGSASLYSSECNLLATSQPKTKSENSLEPCVFGYKSQAYISGVQSSVNLNETLNESCETAPSKRDNSHLDPTGKTRTVPDNDNMSLTELIDFEDNEDESSSEGDNSIPMTLRPLLPWATPEISQDVIGVDPSICLVFLPSLRNSKEQLPYVPSPQKANEDLPHKEQIIPLEIKQKITKYEHPWTPLPIEEYSCNHRAKRFQESCKSAVESPRQIKVYSIDGILLHKSDCGLRTEQVVRKEIQELEDLMQGIGTLNGCSVVVQYQAEINILQNMLRKTKKRVEEIERREEKNKLDEPADNFGLRAFYKNHDEVMEQLRKQHTLCVKELATLTEELNLNTARCHFEKSLNSKTSEETNEGC